MLKLNLMENKLVNQPEKKQIETAFKLIGTLVAHVDELNSLKEDYMRLIGERIRLISEVDTTQDSLLKALVENKRLKELTEKLTEDVRFWKERDLVRKSDSYWRIEEQD
jgi:hypothetical protein